MIAWLSRGRGILVEFGAMARGRWLGIGFLVVGIALMAYAAAPLVTSRAADARVYYRGLALQTQAYTWRHLAYAGGTQSCEQAPYLTYRRDLLNNLIADHWYVALQVRADAALVAGGDDAYRCQVEKALPWMEWLWSPSHSGYAPRADLDGANPTLQDVYADDNAVIGLAFLDIARVTKDPRIRARAMQGAVRAAKFPLTAGLWDGEFGGGLWWTNQRDGLGEGKPAQSTALLAYVMAELYAETGDPVYRQHALDSLAWLDRYLWSEHHQLYAYSVRYSRRNPGQIVKTDRYFGYDQAIVIQALLALHRIEPEGTTYLARARQIARATDRLFWQPELGGYTLEADVPDQYPSYSVWISEALIELYQADGDRLWLDRARANYDTLEARFRVGSDGGYYYRLFPCRDEFAVLCRPGEQYGLDRNIYTLSQAMMQRVAALLAAAS
ncbi:MAG: AGE family epimerase/isomerase [Chloroflexi bacterium]|nr:AGE family epimerase/isomerase [Chloroflexota bacterium]